MATRSGSMGARRSPRWQAAPRTAKMSGFSALKSYDGLHIERTGQCEEPASLFEFVRSVAPRSDR